MHTYGGPGHNTVVNSYGYTNYQWHNYLSSLGYIVVSVDNRGTLKRGANFKKSTYKQLGKLEHLDQNAAAEYFGDLSYIDEDRIGIWGWSFGQNCNISFPNVRSYDYYNRNYSNVPVVGIHGLWRQASCYGSNVTIELPESLRYIGKNTFKAFSTNPVVIFNSNSIEHIGAFAFSELSLT